MSFGSKSCRVENVVNELKLGNIPDKIIEKTLIFEPLFVEQIG